eukprot:gnl/TRDRNA2_/TRDRNA2_37836_c0_seq1.p1 gnl/TRDRNA2_/TRDRNA2_37836_c0~~gnl/TRDRNA2_/TRDRNA2_37836_c0_seq1.p1  ORF type:complete len:237 (-),score=8.45 gnl/TRDRNA2_/TRDRNA2_37836_c0_seq1:191-901(-)
MTTTRDEIVIRELHEIPEDLALHSGELVAPAGQGRYWVELVLPYKPGPLNRAPPVLNTHMPRLDWQFWFVSLDWAQSGRPPRWFTRFLRLLSQRSPEVVKLVQHRGQPKVQEEILKLQPLDVEVTLADYQYADSRSSDPESRNDTELDAEWEQGSWWRRRVVDVYRPFQRPGAHRPPPPPPAPPCPTPPPRALWEPWCTNMAYFVQALFALVSFGFVLHWVNRQHWKPTRKQCSES